MLMRGSEWSSRPSRHHGAWVGIDLETASRHSVRVLGGDGRLVCRSSCVPAVQSQALNGAGCAGWGAGSTRLAVVSGSGWPSVDADRGVLRLPRR
jgi:hypothetical protein